MKKTTVRELRNNYTSVLSWVQAGEEVVITQRGKPVARLIPEKQEESKKVNWADAPEVNRHRGNDRPLTSSESGEILQQAASPW